MRIAWLQDLCPACNEGGAQKTDWGHIKKGRERGHSIEIITPQNVSIRNLDCDLVIISNCMGFPRDVLTRICSERPYVFFHHDFNFCKYRLYYSQLDKCKTCIDRQFWLKLYQSAKLHIWLSPLHREAYLFAFPELEKFRPVCVPSCIDVEKFKPVEGVERRRGTVIGVGALEPFKSRYGAYNYGLANPQLSFTFVGQSAEINLPNCKYLSYVRNEDLPRLYSEHEFYINLPDTVQPFERTAAEAYLSGCKLILNENVGFFSYPWDYKNIEQVRHILKQAATGWWEEVEGVMKK